MSRKDREITPDVPEVTEGITETPAPAIQTFKAEDLDTVQVGGGRSGAFSQIRNDVLAMIPPGQGATVGAVVRTLMGMEKYKILDGESGKMVSQDYRRLYNYVNNSLRKSIQNHNGRNFVVNTTKQVLPVTE